LPQTVINLKGNLEELVFSCCPSRLIIACLNLLKKSQQALQEGMAAVAFKSGGNSAGWVAGLFQKISSAWQD